MLKLNEQAFGSFTSIKNKDQNGLISIENDIWECVFQIHSRTKYLHSQNKHRVLLKRQILLFICSFKNIFYAQVGL